MKNSRTARINDEIMRELAIIIRSELKDPRVNSLTSVTRADIANDLSHCKVYVSILGDEDQKKGVMEGLKNASGFMRKQIAERINLRATPQLTFVLDDSLDYSMKIDTLIKQINKDTPNETNS